jgi:CRP-like cAMP-binding protein
VSALERRAGLAACPLFEGLEREALDHLADASSLRSVRAGETVIREGEPGDCLFVIVLGRVRTEKRTPSGDSWTVRFHGTGGVFGELSLLDRVLRSATVVAEADCTFLVIDRERFHAFGDRHPAAGLLVTRRLAERLAARLRRANEDVVTLFSALVHEVERKL